MGELTKELFGTEEIFLAYRLCGIKKEVKRREYFWEINSSWTETETKFMYIELLSSSGNSYYIYDDKESYNDYKNWVHYNHININFFYDMEKCHKNEKLKNKYFKIYSINKAIEKLNGRLYRLSDGWLVIKDKLGGLLNDVDSSLRYALPDEDSFIDCVKKKIIQEDIILEEYYSFLMKSYDRLANNTQLINELGSSYHKMREQYKKAIEILSEKINSITTQENDEMNINVEDNNNKKAQNTPLDYGRKGEENVEYALKWLPKEYFIISKEVVDEDKKCIWIRNERISQEKQEFDHIVVGPQGVFLIETKNLKGIITIDTNGNWIREVDGNREGIQNPIQQIDRHYLIIRDILGDLVEEKHIYNILCLAHPKVIIEGIENSPLKIVKFDVLNRYIQELEDGIEIYDEQARKNIIARIGQYKITK